MAKPFFELEEMIVDAWPAAETCDLDGWLLRASGGPTRRGNSVATLSCSASDLTLEDRIARAEAFYRERAQPALFQVGPCVQPKELDATLSTRGYEKTGEAAVMVAAPEDLARDSAAEYDVRIERTASAAWSQIALHAGRFANATDALDGALRRLGSRVRFVTGYEAGVACATCYLIASEDRLGIYGMLTLPASRRRGAARDLLRGIGSNAQREQVSELYLMVEHANTAARALYVHSGFRDLYNYHYRGRAAEPDVRA